MLPWSWRWRLAWLVAMVMFQPVTNAAYNMEKHHKMEHPTLFFPTAEMRCGSFRGNNSIARKCWWRTLNVVDKVSCNAGDDRAVAWETNVSGGLVRGQIKMQKKVRVPLVQKMGCAISACDCAINACDYGLVVRGPEELRYAPKELCDGACMELDRWNRLAMGSNQCSERLAFVDSRDYVKDYNLTQEVEPNDIAGFDMERWHYLVFYMDIMDYVIERTFLFVEEFNPKVKCEEWLEVLWKGMRHALEFMSVERIWAGWLVTVCILLWWSHLSLWRWLQTMALRSATRPSMRAEKNKLRVKRAQIRLQLRAILFISLSPCCRGMEGQGEQAFLQQMTVLATAATNAANAAERAIGLMSQSQSSSSAGGGQGDSGLQAAARILKNPEAFTGDDPMAFSGWKFSFCSWLGFGDPRFQGYFEELEKLGPGETIPAYDQADQELSVKLFAILASYLKGRCIGLVKSMAKEKDGFRLWKALLQEFEPTTRQRSLAIAQALSNYPSFVGSKTILEQILAYEQLVQQFEDVSGSAYAAELKIATLVKCSHHKLREHLQLTIGEKTTYSQLKEVMLSYDKACRSWTTENVLKSLQSSTTGDSSGPQPMEVDRVENKGKSKGKGKTKDKGKNWWNYGSAGGSAFGRGRGRGKGRGNKGKGKGKQKGKSKNKGKDFGKKGKNKGKIDSQQCRICLEYGHWSRECPNRMVQQVVNQSYQQHPAEQGQPQQQGVHFPASGQQAQAKASPQSSYQSSTAASTVRRIFTIPMGIPTLSSSSSSVRMVSQGDVAGDVVILDSGSDVSLLPLSYGQCGENNVNPEEVQLRDCQGEHLHVEGYRTVSLVVQDECGEEAELEHSFLIANVKSCILSLGQLYRSGWSVKQHEHGPVLESPDRELRVPVVYQRNSLAISATVCRVEMMDEGFLSPHAHVRAVVEIEERFRPSSPRNNQWLVADGNPFMRSIGKYFVDPRPTWAGNFGYRTTLIQRRSLAAEDHGWHVVEVGRKYLEMTEPFGLIPDLESYAQGEEVVILTILSEKEECLAHFGGLLDAGGYNMEEPYEPESPFREEPGNSEIEGMVIEPELDEGRDGIRGRDIPEFQEIAPALREEEIADVIKVNDVNVTPTSSIAILRAAGRFLGVSTSGSKARIFNRIRAAHVSALRLRALEVARGEFEAMQPHPRFQDVPAQPTIQERKLHEVTHLPFKKWCAVCVQAKSRTNHQRASPPEEHAQRSYPTAM